MQETKERRVQSLGQEDPLEEDMAPHSRILAWRTPCTEEPGGLQSLGRQRVGHDRSNFAHTHTSLDLVFLGSASLMKVSASHKEHEGL